LVLRALLVIVLLLLPAASAAGPATTRAALDRLEEVLELRIDDGLISPDDVMPTLLVSALPRYEDSADWYVTGVIEVLERAFGSSGLRLCEACMVPRAFVEDGYMLYQTGPIGLDEVARLDEISRGDAEPARSAIWVDEHRGGISVRIIDLRTARVIFAQNIDPELVENANSQRIYTLSEELERRARGDSITQAFVDMAVYPGQHISLDWTEHWGARNQLLSGFTVSLFDPIVGIGACHYRAIDFFDIMVGGKVIISGPTVLVNNVGEDGGEIFDPLLTAVGVARVPFGQSNYGAVASFSTNGQFGIGISLLNISLLPVIP